MHCVDADMFRRSKQFQNAISEAEECLVAARYAALDERFLSECVLLELWAFSSGFDEFHRIFTLWERPLCNCATGSHDTVVRTSSLRSMVRSACLWRVMQRLMNDSFQNTFWWNCSHCEIFNSVNRIVKSLWEGETIMQLRRWSQAGLWCALYGAQRTEPVLHTHQTKAHHEHCIVKSQLIQNKAKWHNVGSTYMVRFSTWWMVSFGVRFIEIAYELLC